MNTPVTGTEEAQALAEACVKKLFDADVASQALGIEVVSVAPCEVILAMTITEKMLNGHQICHGGYIFSLADSAFALAANTENHSTIVSGCSIDFVKPGTLSDRLTASAHLIDQSSKIGYYNVVVRNQIGEDIAYLRGRSYRLAGTIV